MKPHGAAVGIVCLVSLGTAAACVSKKEFEEYQQAQKANWDSIATYLTQVNSQSIAYLTKLGKAVCSIEGKVPNLDPTKQICPSGGGDQSTPPPPNWKP